MKGYPYWPGKALRVVNGNVDVRFFGAHDRAQVPHQLVFLLSYDMPQPLKSKKKAKFYVALEELDQHLQKLRAKLGGFEYAPLRTPLDVDRLYLQPISKVTTGRRHSDADLSAQPKGRTVTIVTSSWMRKIQAEGHVKPPGKEKKEKTVASAATSENSKPSPSSRMQGPQIPASSPVKNVNVKSEVKRRNSSERVNLPTGVFEISDRSLNIPQELDINSPSINLDVTDLPDMERHREFQNTLDKLQERILETCRDDSQEEESSPEEPVPEEKSPTPPILNSNNDVEINLQEETIKEAEENPISCDIPTNGSSYDEQLFTNTEEWGLNSKKSCAFSQRLGQTIESCKAKLGIQDIDDEPNVSKTSDSDDESVEDSVDSEGEKETKKTKHESESDSVLKLCSIGSEVQIQTETEVKSLQDSVMSDMDIAENVNVLDSADGLLNESSNKSQDSVTDKTAECEEHDKSEESRANSSCDELVINEDKQEDVNVTQVSEDSGNEQLANGIDHFDSTNSGTGPFKESSEPPTIRNCSDARNSPESENCTMPQLDISTESDIANYAHKLIDFMKELGRDGGSNPQATIRSLELELEKQRWHHQQELVEIKHNTDLVLLEVRASLEIDKEKALSELKRKHFIEKSRALNGLKRKFTEERKKIEHEKDLQILEAKKKQWCAHCQKEAIYYCCWNTSYCDYPCQQANWPSHQESCGQLQGNNLVDIPQNKSITLSKSALVVNSPQVAKSPAVQVQYMPNQTSCYRIMAPNVTMTPTTLSRIPQSANIVTVQAVSRSSTTNTTSITPVSKTYGKSQ